MKCIDVHRLELSLHLCGLIRTENATLRGSRGEVGIHMSKRSILVVDDDRSVRSYLSDFLTSCGYAVECAESGDQAVSRLSAGQVPSLVILDIVMPGINGIEALESVKKINSSIPVIILSAAGQTKTVDRKSTRLNSSHGYISYAVFCLKKKKKTM